MREPIETFTFDLGYDGSRTSTGSDHRHLAVGSQNLIITGNGRTLGFKDNTIRTGEGSVYLTNAGEGFGGLGNYGDTNVKGSIFRLLSALFYVGVGRLRYNGVDLGSDAASLLQLKLLEGGVWSPVSYQAGLNKPAAPTLATLPSPIGGLMTGKLKNGTYSAKVIRIRSSTGVRSLASIQSNIIVVEGAPPEGGTGKTARITMPPLGFNGANRWGIYVSARSFGSTGPHYFLREVNEEDLETIDGVDRSLEIEWADGELVGAELAPIDSYPPPAAMFGGVLGDSVILDGCYGDLSDPELSSGEPGATAVISLPLRPEEYPPDWALYPPEPPTALIRGGDGFFYRFGKNSMGVFSNTGGEPAISFQLLWATMGISYPHNAVVGTGGRIYAKCGDNLVRIGEGGEPDTRWAAPVADEMRGLDASKTVLGWDTDSHSLLVMHEDTMWVYNEQSDAWGPPCTNNFGGDVTSAVTDGNRVIIGANSTATSSIKLWNFNDGDGTTMVAQSDWHYSNGETDTIRQIDIILRADSVAPVTVEVFANGNADTPVYLDSVLPTRVGTGQLPTIAILVPDLESFCVRLSQATIGGDAGFELVQVTGTSRRIRT